MLIHRRFVIIKYQSLDRLLKGQNENENKHKQTEMHGIFILISSICKIMLGRFRMNRWPLKHNGVPVRFILQNDQSTLYIWSECFTYIYFQFKPSQRYTSDNLMPKRHISSFLCVSFRRIGRILVHLFIQVTAEQQQQWKKMSKYTMRQVELDDLDAI